jgi:hypothetical protein
MTHSIHSIVYYPQIEVVSYSFGENGQGVTSLKLFTALYKIPIAGVKTRMFGSKYEAHRTAVKLLD